MSAAPVANLTRGDFQFPNALAENQKLFTEAEIRMMLIVGRRGGVQTYKGPGKPITISDRNWEDWTGMKPRAKEYAIKGLRDKGLKVEGRGDKAVYFFDRATFEQCAPSFLARAESPKPAGRTDKPTPKVHPQCKTGCAMLASDEARKGLTLVVPTNIAHGGAQTGTASVDSAVKNAGPKSTTPTFATKLAHGGAQTVDTATEIWAQTLAALQAYFPTVGVAFLLRLLFVVRGLFQGVTDSELSEAVHTAATAKRKTQFSEGLFLLTVPDCIAAIRRRPKPTAQPAVAEGIVSLLERLRDRLRARGAPFAGHAAEVERLAAGIFAGDNFEALAKTESLMELVQESIYQTAAGLLTAEQKRYVETMVVGQTSVSSSFPRMSSDQQAAVENRYRMRATLSQFGLPGLWELLA